MNFADFQTNSGVTTVVYLDGEVQEGGSDLLAAFAPDGSVRGVASSEGDIPFGPYAGTGHFLLTVYGDNGEAGDDYLVGDMDSGETENDGNDQISGGDGNDIIYKVWKASENEVYPAEAEYAAGTGTWGELITAVSLLEPVFSVTQSIEMQPFMLNMLSFNVDPDNSDVSSVLSNNDVLIVANDAGQYYVPGFGVDQIGSLDITRGLEVFINGAESQNVTVEGLPAELGPVTINPFQVNIISYLPQDCMGTVDVFSGYEERGDAGSRQSPWMDEGNYSGNPYC